MLIYSFRIALFLLTFQLIIVLKASCQQDLQVETGILSIPDKLFNEINKKSQKMKYKLELSTLHFLNKMEKAERRLQRRLAKKDSAAAVEIFGNTVTTYANYKKLLSRVNDDGQNLYSGRIDSMKSAFNFLNNNKLLKQLPEADKHIESSLNNLNGLQDRLNSTENIQKVILERQQYLISKLQGFKMEKYLLPYKKQAYYYRQQLKEYKDIIENPLKLERKLMDIVRGMPSFRKFFQKNSQLGSLFQLPSFDDYASINTQGMQTRAMLMQEMQQRLGTGQSPQQAMTSSMAQARSQIDELKKKANQLSSSDGEEEMKDFKPNDQKVKSFKQRIQLGTNIQSTKSNYFFPTSTDLALSIGYKLNSKSIAGIGASYKVGLGKNFRNIRISHEGIGVRTFIDYKLKSSFWITGGGEANYRSRFQNLEVLKDLNPWQKSALIGVSKKYKVKKLNGNMQLLYDILHKNQMPETQPFIFRFGYTFQK